MLDTNLIETPQDVKHSRAEIRARNEKLAASNLRILNNALADVLTAVDPEWKQIRLGGYYRLLSVTHVNGAGGALVS